MAGSRRKPVDARMTKRQTDKARAAIQVGVIIDRLKKHVDGSLDMSPTQLTAAKLLLAKAMPDLSATEITDVTPDYGTPQEAEARYHEVIQDEARRLLEGLTPEQIAELTVKH